MKSTVNEFRAYRKEMNDRILNLRYAIEKMDEIFAEKNKNEA
jgi:hypothetical protein